MNDCLKGICRLSVVAMRTEPKTDAPLVSQLLFGEHYSVLEEVNDWLRIMLYCDNSEGWISKEQHSSISDEYFNQVNLSDYKVCTDISGKIFFQKKHVHILLGSILPISTNELFKLEEQVAFTGDSKSLSQRREFDFLKEVLNKYHHAPYLEGGKTPFGIDHAGFVQQVFKIGGYKLPRTVDKQRQFGQTIESKTDLQAGDLIFSGSSVFIYLGDDKAIGIVEGSVERIKDLAVILGGATFKRILVQHNGN
jgi:hypothetical protein